MKTPRSLLIGFCVGLLSGILLLVAGWFSLGAYLVVDNDPGRSDAIVVLGGGTQSRLNKAVSMFEETEGQPIILVDRTKGDWNHISKDLCDKGTYDGRPVTCLTGSSNTVTDAQLSLVYCREHKIRKLVVVTDPYHSRRAKIIFHRIFKGSGIETSVVHSGYYGNKLPPEQGWWKDGATMQTVWVEFGKVLYFLINRTGDSVPGESPSR